MYAQSQAQFGDFPAQTPLIQVITVYHCVSFPTLRNKVLPLSLRRYNKTRAFVPLVFIVYIPPGQWWLKALND